MVDDDDDGDVDDGSGGRYYHWICFSSAKNLPVTASPFDRNVVR
jgi:hypothetical protein